MSPSADNPDIRVVGQAFELPLGASLSARKSGLNIGFGRKCDFDPGVFADSKLDAENVSCELDFGRFSNEKARVQITHGHDSTLIRAASELQSDRAPRRLNGSLPSALLPEINSRAALPLSASAGALAPNLASANLSPRTDL